MSAERRVLDVTPLPHVKVSSAARGYFIDGRGALSLARYEPESESGLSEKKGSTSKGGYKRKAKAGYELLYRVRYVECADCEHSYEDRCMQSSTRTVLMTQSHFCACLRRALLLLQVGQRGVLFCPKESNRHVADVWLEDVEEWKFSEAAGISLADAEHLKMQGNTAFGQRDYKRAVEMYTQAVLILQRVKGGKPDAKLVQEQHSTMLSNLAAANFRMYRYTAALVASEEALLVNPNNLKALYWRASVRWKLGDLLSALSDMAQLDRIDPANKEIYARNIDIIKKQCDAQFARMQEDFEKEFLISMAPAHSLTKGVSQYAM
ncbi:Peptidyl-prolyl cis-trans isomerase D [Porphyridium purpureum]|uniref:Peptidyl-prolyl cis-trans isomerase D n=1 Tax=Porphyridium purpureum TaxID=35688 RepID=A0A5J4YQ61_PORPP|nr:Peptidyl-prolyl cis-trans isomerase D [Porphyridium purpureum]|eukprot:POR1699..scf222_8